MDDIVAISTSELGQTERNSRSRTKRSESSPPPARVHLSSAAAVAAARFYLGRVWHALAGATRHPHPTTIAGTTSSGRPILLRPPRLSDAATWRAIRLRDRADIEPFWITVVQDWETRHSERAWVRECLQARSDAKSGKVVRTVIEVDGRLAGQCELWVESFDRRGELGIWIDSQLTGQGYAAAAGRLMLERAFTELHLVRVTAPMDIVNARSARWADAIGMVREGTMASYSCVGGRRRDHDLWAVTAAGWHTRHDSQVTARRTNGS